MSYFDDASLVMIPSGTKTSKVYSVKPIDGSGDLTFTRSNATASRVASNGLIEKVRTNNLLYTEVGTNAAWIKDVGVTVTDGQQDANGGTKGIRIQYSGFDKEFRQVIAGLSGLFTMSVYIKGTASETINLYDGVTNSNKTLNGSWQRFTVTSTQSGSVSFSVNTYGASARDILISFPQFESGDIATDYIATTTAAVSVGPVANVPRLDYLNSSCPKLLLEPQRTNAAQYSEQLDNAAWTKNGVSVTANSAVSPDGYTNADKIVETATTGPHGLTPTYSIANSTTYTFSIFAKKAENDYFIMNIYTGVSSNFTSFNVANGTIGTTGAGATAKIENYANGWYRCSLTVATAATGTPNIFMWTARADNAIEYTGNGTNGTFLYGCQLEAATYATSYIPTLGASVTRGADAASKTGISSLIGQTEGTLFVDFTLNGLADYGTPISVNDGSTTNYIWLTIFANGNLRAELYNGTIQSSISYSGAVAGGRYKMAFGYKANDFALYVNGALVGTDLTGTTFSGTTLSRVDTNLTNAALYSTASESINQALLFKTRLTNAQLAELTTI